MRPHSPQTLRSSLPRRSRPAVAKVGNYLFDRADIFKLTNGDSLAGGRSVAQEVEVTVLGDDDGCVRVKIHEVGMEDD